MYLWLVEDGRDAVRNVDDASGVAGDDEEEAIGRLQDQVLQLLVGEEGRLVGAIGACVASACIIG